MRTNRTAPMELVLHIAMFFNGHAGVGVEHIKNAVIGS